MFTHHSTNPITNEGDEYMNTEELKEYLRDVYNLEARKYHLNEAYWMLDQKKKALLNSVSDIPMKDMIKDSEIDLHFMCWLLPAGVLGIIFGEITMARLNPENSTGDNFLIGLLLGIGIGGILLMISSLISLMVEKKINVQKNIKIKEENKLIQQQNEQNHQCAQWQAKQIEKEMSILKDEFWDTNDILQDYYDLNIIHKSYRNFIPICSIYGYIDTGRCFTLTGHEGAYNLYETERRLNLIITNQYEIISRLGDIRQNQYMLYSAIQESNGSLNTLNNNCSRMISKMATLEQSNNIKAYNSQITAQNTDSLDQLMYYKTIFNR